MSGESIYPRTIKKEEITSSYLNMIKSVKIYLPPGYNELVSYPVIYCQDGDEFLNFGKIATITTRLILEEDLSPAIIVAIPVNKNSRTAQYSPEGSQFHSYCKFILDELIPFVENRYSVRTEPSDRILAGDSLGGTISLHLALDQPDLFQKVISFSGAFYESSQQRIKQEENLQQLEMYMFIGLQEDTVVLDHGTYDFLQMNRTTRQLLRERNATVEYIEDDGTHIWGAWQKQMPYALKYFLK